MKHKTICAVVIVLLFPLMMGSINTLSVKAANTEELAKTVEETIEKDKIELGKISSVLKAAFNKLLNAFKKLGQLASDVSRCVKMYNALDENSDNYPDDLEAFFNEYNKLSVVKRKLVDAICGVLDAKDKLLGSLKKFINIDLYSLRYIDSNLEGNLTYSAANETICEVEADGLLVPISVGVTRVFVTNDNGESETFKIIVGKPILSRSIRLSRNKSCKITIQNDINDIVVSNNCISYTLNGNTLEIIGESKGTAYLYVGGTEGKTSKYKVKFS